MTGTTSPFAHRLPDATVLRALTRLAASQEVTMSSTTTIERDGTETSYSVTFEAAAPNVAVLNRLARLSTPIVKDRSDLRLIPHVVRRFLDTKAEGIVRQIADAIAAANTN